MNNPRTVFLDTKTTGLHASHDEILEIALVDDAGTTLVDTLIRPNHRTDWPGAQRIHGITPDDVRGAPRLNDVLSEIVDAVRDARLVIYSATFDSAFLPEAVAVYAGLRAAHALYAKGQLDEIRAEYPLRFAAMPNMPCTKTVLRSEGFSDAEINALEPAAER